MNGAPEVLEGLMAAAAMEAALATQYHLDKRDLKFQCLKRQAKKLSRFAEDCEDFLKQIVDTIFMLGGRPQYLAGSANERTDIRSVFQLALDAEMAIVTAFNDAYLIAQNAKDADTRNLYEHWIKAHEHRHIIWLEEQLAQIDKFGEDQYLLLQLACD